MNIENLKYPIGKFSPTDKPDPSQIKEWINIIAEFPRKLEELTKDLSIEELNWTYRPGGWAIKQVIHHCSDSHLNAWCRLKLTLSEDAPLITGYHENIWAELPDSLDTNIEPTLCILKGLHAKWSNLLGQLSSEQLKRYYVHAQYKKNYTLVKMTELYAWHGRHHLAHIVQGLKYESTFGEGGN